MTTSTGQDRTIRCRVCTIMMDPAPAWNLTSIQMNKKKRHDWFHKCSSFKTRWTVKHTTFRSSFIWQSIWHLFYFRFIATSRRCERRKFEITLRKPSAGPIYRKFDVCIIGIPIDKCNDQEEMNQFQGQPISMNKLAAFFPIILFTKLLYEHTSAFAGSKLLNSMYRIILSIFVFRLIFHWQI